MPVKRIKNFHYVAFNCLGQIQYLHLIFGSKQQTEEGSTEASREPSLDQPSWCIYNVQFLAGHSNVCVLKCHSKEKKQI